MYQQGRTPQYVQPGERVLILVPYSEVCMHMRVAGTPMYAEVLEGRRAAQLYRLDGSAFSAPITVGEAGFYYEDQRIYCYPAIEVRDGNEV